MMNEERDDGPRLLQSEDVGFWRSSTYREPTWVSLAWIIIPLLGAGLALYAVVL